MDGHCDCRGTSSHHVPFPTSRSPKCVSYTPVLPAKPLQLPRKKAPTVFEARQLHQLLRRGLVSKPLPRLTQEMRRPLQEIQQRLAFLVHALTFAEDDAAAVVLPGDVVAEEDAGSVGGGSGVPAAGDEVEADLGGI